MRKCGILFRFFLHVSRITHHDAFIHDRLNQTIMLVLNRNWQTINI